MPRNRMALRALLSIVWLVLAAAPLIAADGKLVVVEKFAKGEAEMMVGHYTVPADDQTTSKVGLLGIATPSRNSFAFNQAEWVQFVALCGKAIAAKSATWTQVGTMTETGTTDVSHLTVSAGPGVIFVISSPKGGTVSFIVEKADLPRLQKGLRQIRDYLN